MSIAALTYREFDTIDAIYTMDGGEHTIAALAERMRVSYDCIEKRVERMRRRDLLSTRMVEPNGGMKRHVVVRVSELGAYLFQKTYDEMVVAS